MARFGIGTFKIKSYTPSELNISQADLQNYTFELRQRYFHIAGMPAFGLGKFWAMRDGKKLHDPDIKLSQHILDQGIQLKSPWYTYSFPMFAVLVTLIVLAVIQIKDFSRNNKHEKEFAIHKAEILDKIYNPSTYDYWRVENTEKREDFLLHVTGYSDQAISFVSKTFQYGFRNKDWQMYREFLDTILVDTITIAKDSLLHALGENKSVHNWHTGIAFGAIRGKIESVYRTNKPDVNCEFEKPSRFDATELRLRLKNTGLACTIDSIYLEKAPVEIGIDLPLYFAHGDRVRLSDSIIEFYKTNHMVIKVFVHDADQNTYTSTITREKEGMWFNSVTE